MACRVCGIGGAGIDVAPDRGVYDGWVHATLHKCGFGRRNTELCLVRVKRCEIVIETAAAIILYSSHWYVRVGVIAFKEPPKAPKGVRFPATIKIDDMSFSFTSDSICKVVGSKLTMFQIGATIEHEELPV